MPRITQLLVWGLLLVPLAACGSYRPVAALDADERAELQTLAAELQGRTFWIDQDLSLHGELPHRLTALGLTNSPDADFRIRVQRWDSGGWWNSTHDGRFAVTVFTAAIVPVIYTDAAGWRIRVARTSDRDALTVDADEVRRDWRGWLMLPVAILPGWHHYNIFSIPDEDDVAHADGDRLDRAALSVLRLMVDLLDRDGARRTAPP